MFPITLKLSNLKLQMEDASKRNTLMLKGKTRMHHKNVYMHARGGILGNPLFLFRGHVMYKKESHDGVLTGEKTVF